MEKLSGISRNQSFLCESNTVLQYSIQIEQKTLYSFLGGEVGDNAARARSHAGAVCVTEEECIYCRLIQVTIKRKARNIADTGDCYRRQ